MEWRVERPRYRSERSPSAYRCLSVHQVHFWELGLWGTLTLLSLFAGAVMATHQTSHHNQKLGAASGGMGTASFVSMEENSQEAPSFSKKSNWHGNANKVWRGSRIAGREKRSSTCRLRSLVVKVKDLGLGYDSDEIVRFRYCSGSCQQDRTRYNLILSRLLEKDAIVPAPDDDSSSHPCCRPTRFKDFAFVDVHNDWKTVRQLLAAQCSCVGL